jgi:hypothetical protein
MPRRSKRMGKKSSVNRRYLSYNELKTLAYLATLVLVGFLAYYKIEAPAVYAFLGLLIGSIFGRNSGIGR